MNVVVLQGRLGRDPDMRRTSNGKSVCSISLAVDRPTAKGEVDWFDVVLWEKRAEFVSTYVRKGDSIVVRGRLATRSWTGKDGQTKKAVEVVADEVSFAGVKRNDDRGPELVEVDDPDDGELPF